MHLQRENHNSIIITIDPSGEDGTAGSEKHTHTQKKPLKVFCDDKHRNEHIDLDLDISFFVFQTEKINQQTKSPTSQTCSVSPKKTMKGAIFILFIFKHL